MSHTRARLHQLTGLTFFVLLLCVVGQPSTVRAQATQTEEALVAQLATANEEQRLNLLIELTMLFRSRISIMQPPTVNALSHLLHNDPVPLIRTFAAHALEFAGTPAAGDSLLAALKTERELATRKAILYALVRYPAPQVTAALRPLLDHKEPELRATAAYVLAEQADTAAAQPLLALLQKRRKREDAFARSQAARGLGRIGYQAAIPALLKALQDDDAQNVRREAAIALGWLTTTRTNEVLAALREAAQDEDPYLRAAAQTALERINARFNQAE
jgi:HEAT repeat protein